MAYIDYEFQGRVVSLITDRNSGESIGDYHSRLYAMIDGFYEQFRKVLVEKYSDLDLSLKVGTINKQQYDTQVKELGYSLSVLNKKMVTKADALVAAAQKSEERGQED